MIVMLQNASTIVSNNSHAPGALLYRAVSNNSHAVALSYHVVTITPTLLFLMVSSNNHVRD